MKAQEKSILESEDLFVPTKIIHYSSCNLDKSTLHKFGNFVVNSLNINLNLAQWI